MKYFAVLGLLLIVVVCLKHDNKFVFKTKQYMPITAEIVKLKGVIVGLPQIRKHKAVFNFKTADGVLRLNWYGKVAGIAPGQVWRFHIKLYPQKKLTFPGEFNFGLWLKAKGYIGSGQVLTKPWPHLLAERWQNAPLSWLRFKLAQQLAKIEKGQAYKGLVFALLLGDRQYLTQKDWWVFQNTGTSHLIAISGLHIGLVMLFAYGFFTVLFRVAGVLLSTQPCCQSLARWSAFSVTFVYALLAGFSMTTQRALIMLLVWLICWQLKVKIRHWLAISFAFILVLLWQPFSVFSSSFWLSFGAVGLLIYGLSCRVGRAGISYKLFHPQKVVFIGLWPLTLLFFHQFSWVSLFANIVVVPYASFVLMPLLLIALCCLLLGINLISQGCWWLVNKALWLQVNFLAWLAGWPGVSSLHLPSLSTSQLILFIVGGLIILLPRAFPMKILGGFCWLPLFFHFPVVSTGAVRVVTLPNKRGGLTLYQTRHHNIVLVRGFTGQTMSTLKYKIAPFLKAMDASQVDLWVQARPLKTAQSPDKQEQKFNYLSVKKVLLPQQCKETLPWQWDQVIWTLDANCKIYFKTVLE